MPLGGPVCVPMWMCACMCVKGYKDLCLGRPEFKPISLLLALWERGSPPLCLSLLFCELGMVMFAFTCVRINTQHRTHQVTLWLQLTWILLGTPKGAQGTPGKSQEQTSNKLKQSSKPKQVLRGHSSIGQHLTSGTHSTAILNPILTDRETVESPMLFLMKGLSGHTQQVKADFQYWQGKFFPCDLDFLSYVLEVLGVSLELAPKYRV